MEFPLQFPVIILEDLVTSYQGSFIAIYSYLYEASAQHVSFRFLKSDLNA